MALEPSSQTTPRRSEHLTSEQSTAQQPAPALCPALLGCVHQRRLLECQKAKFCGFLPRYCCESVLSSTPVTASLLSPFTGSTSMHASDCTCVLHAWGGEGRGAAAGLRAGRSRVPIPHHAVPAPGPRRGLLCPRINASGGEKGRSGPAPSVAASSRGPAAACQQGTALPVVNFNWPSGESANH